MPHMTGRTQTDSVVLPRTGRGETPMLIDTITGLLSAHDIPEPPPADPVPLLLEWFHEARECGKYDDHNAMCLATATRDGVPSVRMVLCKEIALDGALVFYSNYESRKGRELASNPRAAAAFHWPHATRQARVEGEVSRVSAEESDAYFESRALLSRIGACVSRQSEPIASRSQLVDAAMSLAKGAATGTPIRRPEYWGGYRLRMTSVELWSGRDGRLHQRVRWQRPSQGSGWTHALLSP
jgi:pyridoxamine 5'-phosphate oxidase